MTTKPIAVYLEAATKKKQQIWYKLALRQEKGWEVAHKAAQILKKQFAARKVLLFGSLLDVQRMHFHSDIDLAVWGLAEERYYQAVAKLQDLNPDFSIDLVQIESASPSLRSKILKTGIDLDSTRKRKTNLAFESLS